jgi:prepilin-type N-terminal cleavage/methylation domain-containing protein
MRARRCSGFTLIELLVVIAIIGLASAIVLPALLQMRVGDRPLQSVIDNARYAAAHRGELVYLRIEPSGAWHLEGGEAPLEGEGTSGRIQPLATLPLTLLVSPAGSCAFDVRSASAAHALQLDLLTCTLTKPLTTPVTTSSW